MNYPIWETTLIGGPTLIAIIAILHVFISHFAVGGGLFLWLTDLKGYRENSAEIHAYLRKHIWFFLLLTMVFGAVSGVGIWFIIALVNPAATTTLIHNFVFAWAIEWVFFLSEIVSLLIYNYYFDRLSRKKRLNIAFFYFLFAWLSLFVINGIIDFMLTPGAWLETRRFWDGFFNPTFWPSLFFRSFAAFMLAGLFGYVTTVFLEEERFRKRVLRYCTKWLLLPMLGLIPSALWYYYAVPPDYREVAFHMNRITFRFVDTMIAAMAIIFIFGIILSVLSKMSYQKAAAFLLIPVGLVWIGSFEYIRENARRPFVIRDYMYSNSILKSRVDGLNRDGVLKSARWTAVREINPQNRIEAGRELFNLQCLSCHTVGGVRNDIIPRAGRYPYRGLLAQLTGQGKILAYMPPFAGTEEEKEALAAYIQTKLLHREIPEREAKGNEENIWMGRAEIPPFDHAKSEYVLLAVNDLGMHCISDCDEMFSFMPPANTLEAQLVRRGPKPVLVTEGVELSYKVEPGFENPANHVRFWEFCESLYGVKLEKNVGLAGKGLSGKFDFLAAEGIFQAKFIPVVPYRDDGTYCAYPVFTVEARKAGTDSLLMSTKVVAPVSSEAYCYKCHGGSPRWKGVSGISTGTAGNILKTHDRNHKTTLYNDALAGKPKLCQSCHADLALGVAGKEELLNFSSSIHGWHAIYMSGLSDESCTMCHPIAFSGLTRCLRGVHGGGADRVLCSRCHGTLEDLSISLLNGEKDKPGAVRLIKNISLRMADSTVQVAPREPWLKEPDCFACHVDFTRPAHGSAAFNHWNETPEELYRKSNDNALIRCNLCHGSTHAEYPALNPHDTYRDVIQPMQYSGMPYTIGANRSCAVCHMKEMQDPIHHGNMDRMVRKEFVAR